LSVSTVTASSYLDFTEPAGLKPRGTLIVLPGRGETARSYNRFGSRLAADAYRVRVLGGGAGGYSPDAPLESVQAALTAAVADLGDELIRPLVLVGSDASSAVLSAVVADCDPEAAWWPDGLVLAALPGYGEHEIGDQWESELDARTHCPVHRGVLSNDGSVSRQSISAAVADELLDQAYRSRAGLPQLLLVGDRDPIADRGALSELARALPAARLGVVRGGHHDVLNDLQHRSVAAEIIGFLEALRDSTPLVPLVAVESSAW
jgi:alpha-beta hydrolase superfamily lysophospholipase